LKEAGIEGRILKIGLREMERQDVDWILKD
jgi:hypothetical protein